MLWQIYEWNLKVMVEVEKRPWLLRKFGQKATQGVTPILISLTILVYVRTCVPKSPFELIRRRYGRRFLAFFKYLHSCVVQGVKYITFISDGNSSFIYLCRTWLIDAFYKVKNSESPNRSRTRRLYKIG